MNHGHYLQPTPFYQPQGGPAANSDEPSRVISKDELKRAVQQAQASNAPPQASAHNPFGASAVPAPQPLSHNPFAQGASFPQPGYGGAYVGNPAQSEIMTQEKVRNMVHGAGQGAYPGHQQMHGPGHQGPPREEVIQLTASQYQSILDRLAALEQALQYKAGPATHGQQQHHHHHQQQPQPNYGQHQSPFGQQAQHQQPSPGFGQHQSPFGQQPQQPQPFFGQPQAFYGQPQQPTRPDANSGSLSFGA